MNIQLVINKLLAISNEYLIPFMCISFVLGLAATFSLWFLKRSQLIYAKQIEKKIYMFLIDKEKTNMEIETSKNDFYALIGSLMNVAHLELYEMKIQKMRRKLDYVTSMTDRMFLLIEGSNRLMKDVIMQSRYYDQTNDQPDFQEITTYAVRTNPAYNRLFGIFTNRSLSSILTLLPGLFVIGGIFGTFVGIMMGLPELTHMDLSDAVMTKKTMDAFLTNIAYSMNTSLVGIILCVCMNIFNSLFDADDLEDEFAEKLKSCLALTWREVLTNRKKKHHLSPMGEEPPPIKLIG